jgi:hypothetical protein
MTGLLLVFALLGLVLWIFVALFRRRVQRRLEAAGHELPPELGVALRARARAAGAARPVAPAVAAPVAAPVAVSRPAAGALHFMLIYELAPDFLQRRAQYRDRHLALAWKAVAAGELLLGGVFEEPAEKAMLLFRGSREAARRFAEADPYVVFGLVRQWQVRQWHTVVGEGAAIPLRPAGG